MHSLFIPWEVFHDDAYLEQDDLADPISFAASNNPDIMYLNQAMAAPDKDEFRKAMAVEVAAHVDSAH